VSASDWLRWKKAAEHAGVDPKTLKAWEDKGIVEVTYIDGCKYASRVDIDALFDEAGKRGHLDTTEYAIERRGAK
jgi:predicted site-specific integrase-resolvase